MSTAPQAVLPSVNAWSAEYLDALYQDYMRDPASVPPDLRLYFQGFDLAGGLSRANGALAPSHAASPAPAAEAHDRAQAGVTDLIREYRASGHLCAAIDPFDRERPVPETLNPGAHGLSQADMDRAFDSSALTDAPDRLTLREIVRVLDETYCGSIGVEIAHISSREEREWLARRIEKNRNRRTLARDERVHVLYQLHKAELFEKFCAKRYPGVKRFSLEGAEALIPLLDRTIERAGTEHDCEEIIFGMAHRGRLNVLTNIIGKTYDQVFTEFNDAFTDPDLEGIAGGDVKYHRGYSSSRPLPNGKDIWLVMASNPSHLESVNPVVLGRCRAKQRLEGDIDRVRCIPVLIHGDAAVIGQGVVTETMNMAQLEGYTVGGTIHVVINNLIGFTTGEEDARTGRYCTDFAKGVEAPVFHVNAMDPEAVVHAAEIALDYRMRFKKDAWIDLIGYRLHGHNETDEAAFTQPLLYKEIRRKKSCLTEYAERLLAEGVISQADADTIRASLDEQLDQAFSRVKQTPVNPNPVPGHERWKGHKRTWDFNPVDTAVARETLHEIAQCHARLPEGFKPHDKLVKIVEDRARCVKDDLPIDWGAAEALAFGSMLIEGTLVRITGQDVRRGTFTHRQAVLRDVSTEVRYVPLNHIRELGQPGTDKDVGSIDDSGRPRQAKLCIFDSPLSEFAVLGFEYGFSLSAPNMLVLWEAQFGDFCNGAQTIIDQYIASGEVKWNRWSGLVMLLPHGYEGQGPEHSSGRMERFLQLCADENMQVVNASTPAQYFHLLRRQVKRAFRKPLVVFTPKSLLRAPFAASRVADLASGTFKEVIDDPMFAAGAAPQPRAAVKRVILCSGKVYYDLAARRAELNKHDTAIVRVEQLYPLHVDALQETLSAYPKDAEVVWCQEEPKNMGAYQHMFVTLNEHLGWELPYCGRPAAATPATGSHHRHAEELEAFLTDAVGAKTGASKAAAHH
ncbi:MAG: 2-oxoglutarate dehydrogenase E1 component [Planctomycetes bacterium]|nr:2-oxoglutarate dehydrogenase E1 component [Planctomycetota bacterium]